MKQGILTNGRVRLLLKKGTTCYRPRKDGERKRKSVRGCIVDGNLSVLSMAIIKKGEAEIPGLTDNVILLGQVEKLPDLAGTLGSQPARDGVISQSGDLSLSLLDDGHGKDREVAVDDAP